MYEMTRFLIIDGNSICFRAASAKNPYQEELQNSKGHITGGVYRFVNLFNKACELVRPTHIVVGFDTSKHTFRHDINPEYKANRYTDDNKKEIYSQFDDMKAFLDCLGVKHDNIYLYEGDDMVGSYANISEADRTFILSGDKDIFQLINNSTSVIFPIKGISEIKVYNKQVFKERFNIDVEQFIDYKTLFGDAGDNIKGIDGCGEKTATKLLNKFGSIENILDNLDEDVKDIRGWKKLKTKIADFDYEKTRKLVTIKKDVPIKYSFEDCKKNLNWNNVIPLFEEFEFASYIKKIKQGKFYK